MLSIYFVAFLARRYTSQLLLLQVGGAVKALIGAGTGLGVGCLTPSASGEYQIATIADPILRFFAKFEAGCN